MAPEVLKGELGRLPAEKQKMLTQLRADLDAAADKAGNSDVGKALVAMRAAMEKEGATRASVANEFKARMAALNHDPDLLAQVANAEGTLRADQSLNAEPLLAAATAGVTATGEGLAYAANTAIEVGPPLVKNALNDVVTKPWYVTAPVIGTLVGGSAYLIAKILNWFGRKTPVLDRLAMLGLGAVAVGTVANTMMASSESGADKPKKEAI